MRKMKVLVAVPLSGSFGLAVMSGIYAYISRHADWELVFARTNEDFTENMLQNAIAHEIDGVIIASSKPPRRTLELLTASKTPFVTIETFSPILDARKSNAVFVRIDNHRIGRDAARNFLSQGRCSSYAFVAGRTREDWSALRAEGFRNELEKRGRSCAQFCGSAADDELEYRRKLSLWLANAEKPVALLAEDDKCAIDVLLACQNACLKIPRDAMLFGVDNEIITCENTTPTLSSIMPPFEEAAKLAAGELHCLITQPRKHFPAKTIVCKGPNEIIKRESTNVVSSGGLLVQKALTFIQQNVRKGIGVKDVVAHLHVSRPLVDLRFREIRGESVLTTITKARLDELQRNLSETDEPIESLTRKLGWDSPNYPKNLFKRKFGMTMSDYRHQLWPRAVASLLPTDT